MVARGCERDPRQTEDGGSLAFAPGRLIFREKGPKLAIGLPPFSKMERIQCVDGQLPLIAEQFRYDEPKLERIQLSGFNSYSPEKTQE